MLSVWQGKKIHLRAVTEKDFEEYFAKDTASKAQELYDELLLPKNEQTLKEYVQQLIAPQGDDFLFIIEDMEHNPVGHIHTYECNSRNGSFKYGIKILEEYWRKGYGSEAISILLNYYFKYLRYHKAVSMVYGFNQGSQLLHEKLGFKKEGVLRDMIFSRGQYNDLIFYGILESEFSYTPAFSE